VASLTRAELLRHGGGSAAIVFGGSALSFVPPARADTPSDGDLAYARLLVAAELLAIDFYRRALASKKFRPGTTGELRRSLADERKHYRAVAETLRAAGQTAATAADIDFVYPRRAFASSASTAALGARLESLLLGAYLGAVTGFEADALKLTAARVAASEAQHLSVFTGAASGQRIGPAFPRSLTIDRASAVLDTFTA
jgi:ferritin-like protein